MRIAVAYEDGQVFQHFGHTKRFKIYDTQNGEVHIATTVNTNGSGHGALADILKKLQVDALICGNLGDGAKRALTEANIRICGGVSGDADRAVEAFLTNRLVCDSNATCTHRGEHRDGGCVGSIRCD